VIFVILSACVLYSLYSGVFNQVTRWTWIAGWPLVAVESVGARRVRHEMVRSRFSRSASRKNAAR